MALISTQIDLLGPYVDRMVCLATGCLVLEVGGGKDFAARRAHALKKILEGIMQGENNQAYGVFALISADGSAAASQIGPEHFRSLIQYYEEGMVGVLPAGLQAIESAVMARVRKHVISHLVDLCNGLADEKDSLVVKHVLKWCQPYLKQADLRNADIPYQRIRGEIPRAGLFILLRCEDAEEFDAFIKPFIATIKEDPVRDDQKWLKRVRSTLKGVMGRLMR